MLNASFAVVQRHTQPARAPCWRLRPSSFIYIYKWSQVLSREWRCRWSSADRRCSNCIWVINNLMCLVLETWQYVSTVYHSPRWVWRSRRLPHPDYRPPSEGVSYPPHQGCQCWNPGWRKSMECNELTHLSLDNMTTIPQMIFPDAFTCMKSFVFWIKFPWNLFLMVQLKITQHWFRQWLGAKYQAIIWNNADFFNGVPQHFSDSNCIWNVHELNPWHMFGAYNLLPHLQAANELI